MTQLKRNIVANFIGRGWMNIMGIVFIPMYLHFVGIEGYGLIGFFTMLQGVLGFMDLGIGAALNREMARLSTDGNNAGEQRDLLRTLEIIYWCLACVAGTAVLAGSSYLAGNWVKAQSIAGGEISNAIRLMGLSIILQFPVALYQGGLMGLQKQVLVNAVLMVTGSVRAIGAVMVLWLWSPTVQAFMVWQLLCSGLAVGAFIVCMWKSLPVMDRPARFSGTLLKGIWRYAAAMGGNSIIGMVLTQLDKVILSRMLPLEVFGYYVLAGNVAAVMWSIIVPFNSALFPRFVQLFETGNLTEINNLLHRSSQALSAALLPVAIVLAIFSKEILLIWTQNAAVASNAHIIVTLLVAGTMINGLTSVPSYAATAFSWPQVITYTNLVQAIVLVPAIIIMATIYGAVGAGLVWVGLNCTYIVIMMPLIFRRFFRTEKREWYLKDIGMPLVGSLVIALIARQFIPPLTARIAAIGWIAGSWLLCSAASALLSSHIRNRVLGYFKSGLTISKNHQCF